jgi:hypothetical protein
LLRHVAAGPRAVFLGCVKWHWMLCPPLLVWLRVSASAPLPAARVIFARSIS